MKFNHLSLLLFALLLLPNELFSQGKFIEIHEVSEFEHLAPKALIVEDADGELEVGDILLEDLENGKVIESNAEVPYMDFTSSVFWMKLKVSNPSRRELNYYLELARPLTNQVQLFVFSKEGKLIHKFESGDDYPFDQRAYTHRKFIFPINFPANMDLTLIVRTSSDGEIVKLPAKLWEVEAFTQFASVENFFIGLYYGIFILVIILFSLFGLALGERLYLYFVSYITALAIFQFSLDGLAFQYFWPSNPWMGNHAILIFATLSMIGMFLYVRQFLGFKNDFPRYNLLYNIFLVIFGIILLISLSKGAIYAIGFPLANGMSFIAVLYILLGIYLKAKKEKKIEVPILLAFISLTISSILFILCNVDIIHSEFLASNALKFGSGTELIFLSIAMAGRYRRTQIEKIEAQKEAFKRLQEINQLKSEQTERLEKEVEVRTREIKEKSEQLSSQNKEILNSISYAKRLQDAILPTDNEINASLPEATIFFKPKDIVSGDFYWLTETEDKVFFAVADCTGHGVPGAMVSVLGNNSLNRCIQEFELEDAGEILDKLRSLVVDTFSSEKVQVSDGMDIALCVWDRKHKLQFAGAYNPLYLIRNGELVEIKGDKQPIGYYENISSFTTHQVELQKGDSIVLFSDGYADQFGGPKGKKYKYGTFKKLLLELNSLKPQEWQKAMDQEMYDWMGDLEQIDDICVMTVRF
jgi:serine phosphatase RsbU (regulator of sigma subunit)